ncbi:MAG: alcohol dehydrogenase catalytic domain-containing protein, partial [Ruminococcus sp.]|nr:alcohol dehydrogenase catalytic domain-containing protein [Ruminococcus sp.]
METMKARVLREVGNLEYCDYPMPEVKPDEVLFRVRACGVCGSDIPRIFVNGTYHFPTIPGHEFAGEVAGVGDEKNKHLIGMRATVFPLIPCRQCENCNNGDYEMCKSYDYLGSRSDGGYAQYVRVPVWNLVPIPDNVSFEVAAMTEPCAVALHALRRAQ